MVSQLLFADDSLVFCDSKRSLLGFLRPVLLFFQAVPGLKINIHKYEIIPVGEVENLENLTSFFGCKAASLPTSYLGLPQGAPFKNVAVWNPVMERYERRLAGWKRQYLSKGGRLTLIKSTLGNLPTYFMSIFTIPVSVSSRMEKLVRDFLWEGKMVERKYHLVNWDSVCSNVKDGGLGIKNFRIFNRALMGKWLWRYLADDKAL